MVWNYIKLVFLIVLIQGLNQGCGFIVTPKAKKISGTSSVSFSHSSSLNKCNICHSNDRPNPPHTQSGDCVSCHTHPNWNALTNFSHSPLPNSCNDCHSSQRPLKLPIKPERPKGGDHPKDGDCVKCHTHPDWNDVANFIHSSDTISCNGCHSPQRPPSVKDKLFNLSIIHPPDGDCKDCHTHPEWSPAPNWDHSKQSSSKRCDKCHVEKPSGHVQTNNDCGSCHAYPSWANATFDHDPPPKSCGDVNCHRDDRPASGDRAYPKQGPPRNNTSKHGTGHYLSEDCSDCHQVDQPWKLSGELLKAPLHRNLNYCLPCHYDEGLKDHKFNEVIKDCTDPNRVIFSEKGNCEKCHTHPDWDKIECD